MADYLKIPEIARTLDVSEKTARRYVKEGVLPSVFIGGAYRVSEEDLEAYLRGAKVQPGKAPGLALQLELEEQSGANEQQRLSLFIGALRGYLWDLRLRRQEPGNRPSPGEIVGAIKLLQRLTDSGVFEGPWSPHDRLQIQWLTQAANVLKPVAEEFESEGDEQKLDQALEEIGDPLEQSSV